AVVFPYGSPRTISDVWPPAIPMLFTAAGLVQASLFCAGRGDELCTSSVEVLHARSHQSDRPEPLAGYSGVEVEIYSGRDLRSLTVNSPLEADSPDEVLKSRVGPE